MIWLTKKIEFPPYELATKDGVLALGGDLSSERLIYAYSKGVFPWFNELRVSKSMKQVLRKGDFEITENTVFEEVIFNCKNSKRKDQDGTWITNDMEQAYIKLHHKGVAKSIEVWQNEELVGGLYGIDLGKGVFCGESMFSKANNMSKVAFMYLVQKEDYKLIDCQVYNDHLASLGAREIDRVEFLKYLK